MEGYLIIRDLIRNTVLPTMLDGLCNGANCFAAAQQSTVETMLAGKAWASETTLVHSPDKVFWVMGLTLHTILFVTSCALLFVALCVWKVFHLVKFYVGFLLVVNSLNLSNCFLAEVFWHN